MSLVFLLCLALKILFQSCQTVTKSFLLHNSLMGVVVGDGPYKDTGQNAPPFPGADCDEVRSGGAVIVVFQPYGFPLRMVHDTDSDSTQ